MGDIVAISEELLMRELNFTTLARDEDHKVASRDQLIEENYECTQGRGKCRELVSVSNGMYGLASTWADMDEDGHLDHIITGDFGSSSLWWNNGNGTFTHGTQAANVGHDQNGMGSSIADFDGDGNLQGETDRGFRGLA
jgi:hypothetical protein